MDWLIFLVVSAAVFGGFGAWIAAQKRRGIFEGFVLGLLFGPLGVLVEAMLPMGIGQLSSLETDCIVQPKIDEGGVIAEEEAVAIPCLACGEEIPGAKTRCPACGWSYVGDKS